MYNLLDGISNVAVFQRISAKCSKKFFWDNTHVFPNPEHVQCKILVGNFSVNLTILNPQIAKSVAYVLIDSTSFSTMLSAIQSSESTNSTYVPVAYDNPVFLEKLDKFIEAFAKEYDNPDEVDYIDAYGLGRWGEGHGLVLEKQDNLESVIRQITESYARHFKKVLTVMNLSQSDYRFSKPLVYDKLGFLPRRDGIGSFWFSNEERAMVHDELFPKRALIGEGCWWFNAQDGDNSKYKHFQGDKRFAMNDFKEAFTVSVTDALDSHCNTLDLRMPLQCKFWIEELPDQVQRFITLGGYRLYPDYIKVEQDHKTLTLFHSWKNYGVGVLPNNHPNWNYKYQVSFVLMNEKKEIVFLYTEPEAEPSEWLKGISYNYLSRFNIPAELQGKYTLCVGLTDKTKNNEAAIDLAVSGNLKIGKWIFVVELEL